MCNAYHNSFTRSLLNSNTTDLEEQLVMLSSILEDYSTLISEECLSVVVPFLCHHAYPPCDGNNSIQLLTQEQCINIRDSVCVSEWRFVMATELGSLLPVCEAFDSTGSSLIKEENRLVPPKYHDQFKEFCGLCLPLCGKFSQYRGQLKLTETLVIVIVVVVAFIGGIMVFVAATIRRKENVSFSMFAGM